MRGTDREKPAIWKTIAATGRSAVEVVDDFRDGLRFPKAIEIFESGEGARAHLVDVKCAVKVIDFVLEDASVPAGSEDRFFFSVFVPVGNADLARSRDEGGKTGETETAFEELDGGVADEFDSGIDDDVEGHGAAFFFFQLGRRNCFQEVFAIFDHGQLQRKSDLRGCEAHAGSVVHCFAHVVD